MAMAHDNSRTYFVYILASKPRGTLYVGVTNSILTRIEQHRAGIGSAFTKCYRVHSLVWLGTAQRHHRRNSAREKTIKHYTRDWKINLIERENPDWLDLYPTLPVRSPIHPAERWILGTSPRMTFKGGPPG